MQFATMSNVVIANGYRTFQKNWRPSEARSASERAMATACRRGVEPYVSRRPEPYENCQDVSMRRVQGSPLVGPCFPRRQRRSAEIGRFNVEPDRRDEHPLGRMPDTRSPAPFGFVAAPPEWQARFIRGLELKFTAQYLRDDRCRTARSTVSASGSGRGSDGMERIDARRWAGLSPSRPAQCIDGR